jgi:dynein heavy chain
VRSLQVPYEVIRFLTSSINYGGRVTDAIDARTMDVIMKQFCNESLLSKDTPFDSDQIYRSIEVFPNRVREPLAHSPWQVTGEDPLLEYTAYIESLPLNASPQLFGLHMNANISSAQNETFELFSTITHLTSSAAAAAAASTTTTTAAAAAASSAASSSSSTALSTEFIVSATAKEIEARIEAFGLFDVEQVTPLRQLRARAVVSRGGPQVSMRYAVKYSESMNTVLLQVSNYTPRTRLLKAPPCDRQECIRFNSLTSEILKSLPRLRNAIEVPVARTANSR